MKSVISWSRDSSSNLDSSSKMLQGRKTLERFSFKKQTGDLIADRFRASGYLSKSGDLIRKIAKAIPQSENREHIYIR